jgi:hypothetical protein
LKSSDPSIEIGDHIRSLAVSEEVRRLVFAVCGARGDGKAALVLLDLAHPAPTSLLTPRSESLGVSFLGGRSPLPPIFGRPWLRAPLFFSISRSISPALISTRSRMSGCLILCELPRRSKPPSSPDFWSARPEDSEISEISDLPLSPTRDIYSTLSLSLVVWIEIEKPLTSLIALTG